MNDPLQGVSKDNFAMDQLAQVCWAQALCSTCFSLISVQMCTAALLLRRLSSIRPPTETKRPRLVDVPFPTYGSAATRRCTVARNQRQNCFSSHRPKMMRDKSGSCNGCEPCCEHLPFGKPTWWRACQELGDTGGLESGTQTQSRSSRGHPEAGTHAVSASLEQR